MPAEQRADHREKLGIPQSHTLPPTNQLVQLANRPRQTVSDRCTDQSVRVTALWQEQAQTIEQRDPGYGDLVQNQEVVEINKRHHHQHEQESRQDQEPEHAQR